MDRERRGEEIEERERGERGETGERRERGESLDTQTIFKLGA